MFLLVSRLSLLEQLNTSFNGLGGDDGRKSHDGKLGEVDHFDG